MWSYSISPREKMQGSASGGDSARQFVGADGERSRQRRRSATDAAYPLRVHIGPRSARRFHGNLRRIRRFPMGRCRHRPLQYAVQYRNRPSIPEMSRTEIDAVCPQMRVVHSSEPKAIGMVAILRPKRAFRPRSGQKIARVSAQYNASPSASFCLLFLARQKK